MAETLIGKTERFHADSLAQAEGIIARMKEEHGDYIKQHIIAKRTKATVEFFIVTVTIEYYKISELIITE